MKGTPSCPIKYFADEAYAKGKNSEPGSETKIDAFESSQGLWRLRRGCLAQGKVD